MEVATRVKVRLRKDNRDDALSLMLVIRLNPGLLVQNPCCNNAVQRTGVFSVKDLPHQAINN